MVRHFSLWLSESNVLMSLQVCQLYIHILLLVLICYTAISSLWSNQLKQWIKERFIHMHLSLLTSFYSQKNKLDRFYIIICCTSTSPLCPPPPLLPVCHCRALSLALGQGEATFSQVELQSASLHQPVRRLQDLRSQGLRLGPLVRALAAPRSRFGDNTPWGGRRLGLLTDAIQVFHWVFASFTSSGTTTAGKHCYLQSSAANWWKPLLSFARFCLQHLL